MIKKIIYSILAISTFAIWTCLPVNADTPEFWAWNWRDIWVVWTNETPDTPDQEPKAFRIIRKTINRVLSLLWVIALIFCLIWWFKILTAAGDDAKVKTWWKILKNAAIWLVVIWLSWIMVRFVFRLITSMGDA